MKLAPDKGAYCHIVVNINLINLKQWSESPIRTAVLFSIVRMQRRLYAFNGYNHFIIVSTLFTSDSVHVIIACFCTGLIIVS